MTPLIIDATNPLVGNGNKYIISRAVKTKQAIRLAKYLFSSKLNFGMDKIFAFIIVGFSFLLNVNSTIFSIKGTSINSFASRFSEFFIVDSSFCSTIGIMQENSKKDMGNSENPTGTKIMDNLTSSKYFKIATAIEKYFGSHLIHSICFLKEMN